MWRPVRGNCQAGICERGWYCSGACIVRQTVIRCFRRRSRTNNATAALWPRAISIQPFIYAVRCRTEAFNSTLTIEWKIVIRHGGQSAKRQKAADDGKAPVPGDRHDSEGACVHGSPGYGAFDPDPPLQSLLHVLQRIRRLFEARPARHRSRAHRQAWPISAPRS